MELPEPHDSGGGIPWAPLPEPDDPAATSDAGGGGAEEVEGVNFSNDGSEEMLLSFCRKYGVGEDYEPHLAEDGWEPWRKTPPEGSEIICVFDSMLKVGVQFPLHDFYVDYLLHYSIAPSQVTPNAWRYLVGFVKLCDVVGIPPTVAVFQHYFSFKMCPNQSGKRWYYYYILPSPSRRLFKPDALPSNEGWKKRFFFLKSTAPWRCPEKWGMPKPASFADPELTDAEKKATERLESWKEKNVSLMELLHDAEPDADDAASMPPPKKKYKSLGAIAMESSPPPDLVPPKRPSHHGEGGDGGEHYSASRMLMDASKAVQKTEEELQNAKNKLWEERTKHAAEVAQMKEALGAAKAEHTADVAQLKEKLQALEAEHAKTLQAATAKEREAAAEAKVRRLMDEVEDEKAKRLTKVEQLNEDLRAAKAEHDKKLQAERDKRAAEVTAIRAECQRKVIQEKHTRSTEMGEMLRKKYDEGCMDMMDLVAIVYPSIDPAWLTNGSTPPGFLPHQVP